MNTSAHDPLAQLLRHYFLPHGPGCAVVVHQQGQLLFQDVVGLSSSKANRSLSLSDRIDLASCSKMLTATAIMQLVEQNQLALHDPINRWFGYTPSAGRPIQVIDCLRHTSGITDYLQAGMYTDPALFKADAIKQALMTGLSEAKPGSEHQYSNSNYVILAHIIEQVCQDSYQNVLSGQQFEPLGICADFLPANDGWLLTGSGFAKTECSEQLMVEALGDGGIGLSAVAAAQWLQGLISGQLLRKESLQLMTQMQTLDDGTAFGYGLGLVLETHQEQSWFGHNGSWTSSTCLMGSYPVDNLQVVILSNEFMAPVERLACQIHHILTGR